MSDLILPNLLAKIPPPPRFLEVGGVTPLALAAEDLAEAAAPAFGETFRMRPPMLLILVVEDVCEGASVDICEPEGDVGPKSMLFLAAFCHSSLFSCFDLEG